MWNAISLVHDFQRDRSREHGEYCTCAISYFSKTKSLQRTLKLLLNIILNLLEITRYYIRILTSKTYSFKFYIVQFRFKSKKKSYIYEKNYICICVYARACTRTPTKNKIKWNAISSQQRSCRYCYMDGLYLR